MIYINSHHLPPLRYLFNSLQLDFYPATPLKSPVLRWPIWCAFMLFQTYASLMQLITNCLFKHFLYLVSEISVLFPFPDPLPLPSSHLFPFSLSIFLSWGRRINGRQKYGGEKRTCEASWQHTYWCPGCGMWRSEGGSHMEA